MGNGLLVHSESMKTFGRMKILPYARNEERTQGEITHLRRSAGADKVIEIDSVSIVYATVAPASFVS